MAIFAGIFAALSRFLGRIVTMALGWASVLLFGRVPQNKQLLLSFVSLGSLAWMVVLLGVFFPVIGAFLLAFIPGSIAERVPNYETVVRLVMLAIALLLPLLIGVAGLILMDGAQRPKGAAMVKQVLRGYLYAPVLAFTLVFLAVLAVLRKGRSMIKRWTDAHVAVVVKPGGYEQVADDLEHALDEAGLEIERVQAPKTLEAPAKLLAKIGGSGVAGMVPDHLIVLRNPALEVLVYPSDISISGKKADLAAARAAVASRLTFTKAYLTSSKEPQQIEDRLERIATKNMGRSAAAVELEAIDVELSKIDIPYEEWEVLYRLRLQVERNLLATGAADEEAGPHEAANRTAQQQGQQAAQAATQAAVVAAAIPLILGLLDKRLSKTPLRPLVGLLRRAIP